MIELRENVTEWDIDVILAYYITGQSEFPISDGQCYKHDK